MFSRFKAKFKYTKEKFISSKIAKVSTTTTALAVIVTTPAYADASTGTIPSGLNEIVSSMTSIFSSAQTSGIIIVGKAIGLGVVFLVAKWLWGKTRQWISKV